MRFQLVFISEIRKESHDDNEICVVSIGVNFILCLEIVMMIWWMGRRDFRKLYFLEFPVKLIVDKVRIEVLNS